MVKKKDIYNPLLKSVINLIDEARRFSARAVNAIIAATYWEIGRQSLKHIHVQLCTRPSLVVGGS